MYTEKKGKNYITYSARTNR